MLKKQQSIGPDKIPVKNVQMSTDVTDAHSIINAIDY